MTQVFKYYLDPQLAKDGDWIEAEFEAPDGGGKYVHTIAEQYDRLAFWMDVDTSQPPRTYQFVIVPTGGTVPEHLGKGLWFLDTVLMDEGRLVWHVFGVL